MSDQYTEKQRREIQTLKGLMNRGPRNRFQGMVLRALKNRYPGVADANSFTGYPRGPATPPVPNDEE